MITDRRFVLAGMALVAATPLALAETKKMSGSKATIDLPAMPMADLKSVKTAADYYAGVLPRAELSLATSKMAVETATNRDAREFAGFELAEAINVNMVLKNLGAKAAMMDDVAKSAVDNMKSAHKGTRFDRTYIALQLANHQDLRDWADAYLQNSIGDHDPAEVQGRSLATLMLTVFKEHTAICKRILAEMKA